jgi:hypothetical protein
MEEQRMILSNQYDSPRIREIPVQMEQGLCGSEQNDSMNGAAEGVGYDNWLDGLE